jgi:hypothetical protein
MSGKESQNMWLQQLTAKPNIVRDVNLHPSVGILAGIAPFGAPGTGIFHPWGWRKKLLHRYFGAGIGKEASVPRISRSVDIPKYSYRLMRVSCTNIFKKKKTFDNFTLVVN